MKKREVLRRGSVFALGALVLGLSTTTAVGQVFAADSNSTAKTYGIDAFGADYSKGILFRNANFNSTVSPMSVTLPSGGTATTIGSGSETVSCWTNTSKSGYLLLKNGAIYNDEYLDVREYVWLGTDSGANGAEKWCHRVDGDGKAVNDAFLFVTRKENDNNKSVANVELHFYKAGTNTEVDFHGVVGMNDFEKGEQYKMVQGGGQVYLNKSTLLTKLADKTWGVASTSDDAENNKYELWVEVDGTSNKPLKFQYMVDGDYSIAHSYRGSGMMMSAVKVSYKLIGDVPSGTTAPTNDIVTQYGKIVPASAKSVDGYTFDGWYYDQALTNKVGTTMDKINSDTTLYGKYVKDEEGSSNSGAKTPDTGLFTGESGFSKFGGVAAVAGAIAAGLTGYAVYKNRKHLFKKVGFGKKGF